MKIGETIIVLLTVAVILTLGCIGGFEGKKSAPKLENMSIDERCKNSGGEVVTKSACKNADDFPNTCEQKIGWSGCAPEESSPHQYCECGKGRCFDGDVCVRKSER